MASDEAEDKIPTGFVIKVYETKVLAEEGSEETSKDSESSVGKESSEAKEDKPADA